MSNAVKNHGIDDLTITEDDLEVYEQEHLSACATVLMVDISHSMILYGEDRITPAKKIALALTQLIQTPVSQGHARRRAVRRRRHAGSAKRADEDPGRSLPHEHARRAPAGAAHPRTRKGVNKQIFMITDGKPSAIREHGRLYKNPFGLDPKIVNKTLEEASYCRRKKRITITTFMLATDARCSGVRAQADRAEPRPDLRDRPEQPRRVRVPGLRAESAQATALISATRGAPPRFALAAPPPVSGPASRAGARRDRRVISPGRWYSIRTSLAVVLPLLFLAAVVPTSRAATAGWPMSVWAPLAPSPDYPGSQTTHTAIYDPVRDRMVVYGGDFIAHYDEVWTLSLGENPAWTKLTVAGTTPGGRADHAAIYDPVRDRMLLFGGDNATVGGFNQTWQLTLGASPTWTKLLPSGSYPLARYGAPAIYDPVRDRMVVFGGYSFGTNLNDVWALSLGPSPQWIQITPAGTPPSPRSFHSTVYDPVGDRLLVFGGEDAAGQFSDTWQLTLGATPEWTQIALAGGHPSARSFTSTIYDPWRHRVVLFGGGPVGGTPLEDLWELMLISTPEWASIGTTETPPTGRRAHSAIYDPVRDRMVGFAGAQGTGGGLTEQAFTLTWGERTGPLVGCDSTALWVAGTPEPVCLYVTNTSAAPQTFDITIEDERGWPGFPFTTSRTVAALSMDCVDPGIAAPDTAHVGLNRLTFRARWRLAPLVADTCEILWGDATTPVAISWISALAERGRVRLRWFSAEAPAGDLVVERRDAVSAWEAVGHAVSDGRGEFSFEDATVAADRLYAYRVRWGSDSQASFSDERWVDTAASLGGLALAPAQPNPASRSFDVSFTLDRSGPVTLELFDPLGRRVRTIEPGTLAAGPHRVAMRDLAPLPAGVYRVRLTHDGRRLTRGVALVR